MGEGFAERFLERQQRALHGSASPALLRLLLRPLPIAEKRGVNALVLGEGQRKRSSKREWVRGSGYESPIPLTPLHLLIVKRGPLPQGERAQMRAPQ